MEKAEKAKEAGRYLPFTFTDPEKAEDAEDLMNYLEHTVQDGVCFEIRPSSAKLLQEILDVFVENYQ
jgi:hypothetical protein